MYLRASLKKQVDLLGEGASLSGGNNFNEIFFFYLKITHILNIYSLSSI